MRFKKDFILEKIEEVKLNELRIGNFVYSLSDDDKTLEFVEISEIHDDMVYFKECNFDGTIGGTCYPIELTEDWLIKIGFEKTVSELNNIEHFYNGYMALNSYIKNSSSKYFWLRYYQSGNYVKIKTLHQLQNLYFALTGEELTIKK